MNRKVLFLFSQNSAYEMKGEIWISTIENRYTPISVYTHTYVHIQIYTYTHTYIQIHTHICLYVSLDVKGYSSLILACKIWVLNSGIRVYPQTWQQSVLPHCSITHSQCRLHFLWVLTLESYYIQSFEALSSWKLMAAFALFHLLHRWLWKILET